MHTHTHIHTQLYIYIHTYVYTCTIYTYTYIVLHTEYIFIIYSIHMQHNIRFYLHFVDQWWVDICIKCFLVNFVWVHMCCLFMLFYQFYFWYKNVICFDPVNPCLGICSEGVLKDEVWNKYSSICMRALFKVVKSAKQSSQ